MTTYRERARCRWLPSAGRAPIRRNDGGFKSKKSTLAEIRVFGRFVNKRDLLLMEHLSHKFVHKE